MLTFGYLTFINDSNKHLRINDFRESLESLKLIQSKSVEFVSIDNDSCEEVKDLLCDDLFSCRYHYSKNFLDIALFYTTLWHAQQRNHDYMIFSYDDFIIYNDAIDDSISFLEDNQDVHCVRITKYDFQNRHLFDSNITPKSSNPDSVRHYNTFTNEKLLWEGPIRFGDNTFYKNNWQYTSRPTLWRRSYFENIIARQGHQSFVLQEFESWAIKEFHKEKLKTGVLDFGMMHTTPIQKSVRTVDMSTNKYIINVNEMRSEFDSMQRKKNT